MNTILSVITVFAIIVGPILAIQAQQLIVRITQRRDEKRRLFMTLMATRGLRLAPEHVQALNMIDIIFTSKSRLMGIIFSSRRKKEEAVIDAWSEFRDHLYDCPTQPTSNGVNETSKSDTSTYKDQLKRWSEKSNEFLIELLGKMAESLGYHFDKVLLKKGSYTPQKYGDVENLQMLNMAGLADILYGTKSLRVNITNVPSTEVKEGSKESPS